MNEPANRVQKKPLGSIAFYALAVAVGIVAGIGAALFRGLIAFFHNLLFLGTVSTSYRAEIHTPASPWGPFVILVPVAGAVGVAFLVTRFAPEAKGHGVPEVIDAIYYNKGVIRPVVALVKALASALSIGSGGSVGREGPIAQIGSAFGSTVGQIVSMPIWQRVALVAAGAGSGIAATFNTPVGGILFAAEVMMHEISARTLIAVAIATATATYVGRLLLGANPSFVIPAFERPYFHATRPLVLASYVGLGLLAGIAATLFVRWVYWFEDVFERIPGGYYVRHGTGMLLVGVLIWVLQAHWGHYFVEGVGYATVQDVLMGDLGPAHVLLALFALKLLATCVTLGSGASGGIFSPALFMGATLGGAYGTVLQWILPGLGVTPPAFAVAGMAGMVGGATGAAVASIVMIFEMTFDYSVVIPMTITVALSYAVRKRLSNESIYALKLVRRGHYVPEALQANFRDLRRAAEIMDTDLAVVPGSLRVAAGQASGAARFYLVESDRALVGVLTREALLEGIAARGDAVTLGDIATKRYAVVPESATLFDTLAQMRVTGSSVALVGGGAGVSAPGDVKGAIGEPQIAAAMRDSLELFVD